jgi:hypothetical protein
MLDLRESARVIIARNPTAPNNFERGDERADGTGAASYTSGCGWMGSTQ